MSILLLAGYLSLNLMGTFCIVESHSSSHHHHQAPLQHQHTPLCSLAHSVGTLLVSIAGTALLVFFPRQTNSPFQYAQLTRLLLGSSLYGRAPPCISD